MKRKFQRLVVILLVSHLIALLPVFAAAGGEVVRAGESLAENRGVSLSGEFRFPGKYAISKGEKLSSLLKRAGGFTDRAFLRGAVFTRKRVQALQQKDLEEIVARLCQLFSTAGGRPDRTELEQKQRSIQSLKELKATGRVTIHLAHARLLKGSDDDIELEDGDELHLPAGNGRITVSGAVMAKGSFIYDEKYSYKDYIDMTGGYSDDADQKHIFVLKADGSARKLARGFVNWNAAKSRWQFDHFGDDVKEIEPGDRIIVPEKIDRIDWLRDIPDIDAILMRIAVMTGVAVKPF